MISARGGTAPLWSENGAKLFYISSEDDMMVVSIGGSASRVDAGLPMVLFKARTREELTQVLRKQLASLTSSQKKPAYESLKSDVEEEISLLEAGTHFFPWQGGLPPHVAASINPYRERLDEVFCEAAVRLELRQKNQHPSGLGK